MKLRKHRTAKVVASVGRATIRKEDAKGFIAPNPAQTIDVIKNKLTALEKRISKSDFIAWCRDTDLQQQVAKGLEHCETFLTVWKEKGSTIKQAAKAA